MTNIIKNALLAIIGLVGVSALYWQGEMLGWELVANHWILFGALSIAGAVKLLATWLLAREAIDAMQDASLKSKNDAHADYQRRQTMVHRYSH